MNILYLIGNGFDVAQGLKTSYLDFNKYLSFGSLDIRKIIEVFSKHGCTVDESNRERYAESFLCVKTCRNKLAHGNIAFSTCCSTYLLSDLVKFKNDIIAYREVVVRDTGVFMEHRMYKRSI